MSPRTLSLGPSVVRLGAPRAFGLVIEGPAEGTPSAYLDAVFADVEAREAFFQLVDREGLVVCKQLDIDPEPYRRVGGKRTKGRLSQGEYFHHDGCSTPERPRVNEIRCPEQRVLRTHRTAIARFPETVRTLVLQLPADLRRTPEIARWHGQITAGEAVDADWEEVQGQVNRVIRGLKAAAARAYLEQVDQELGAFSEPWTFRESRFMANDGPTSVQHRRACYPSWRDGTPNGYLLKRWPAEELPPA